MMAHRILYPTQQKNMEDLLRDLHMYELDPNSAERLLLKALKRSEKIIGKAATRTAKIVQGQRSEWIDSFNKDKLLRKWFGEVTQPRHVRSVHNGLESAGNRMKGGLSFRFRPQVRKTSKTKANGTNFSYKALNIYPGLFRHSSDPNELATVFIHELMQLWFSKQQLNGNSNTQIPQAELLAVKDPELARKNAENYERFCLELWHNS